MLTMKIIISLLSGICIGLIISLIVTVRWVMGCTKSINSLVKYFEQKWINDNNIEEN